MDDFDKTSNFFLGVWAAGPTVRSTGDGNSKGTTKLPSAVTTVQTDGPRTRKGRKGRRKIRVGFTHGRASRRSVRCNGFFQGLFHRPERTGTHPSTISGQETVICWVPLTMVVTSVACLITN